ncbi:MAG: hypothetical protein ABIN36_03230 [Ferruginibacter sp.]
MKITFNRNIQFTKLLKINGRLKEFNFRKANPSIKGNFTIDVLDDEGPMGTRIIFYMENKDDRWQIISKELPGWVLAKENELNDFIIEELK